MTNIKRELIMFLMVGSLNTVFGYGLFCLFIFLGLHHLLAISLSFMIGVFFSFNTIGRFVFRSHNSRLILKFLLLYLFLYFVNIILLSMLKYLSHNWYFNGLITTIVAAGLSFILNKFWVFRTKEQP